MGGHTRSSDRAETVGGTGASRILDRLRKGSEARWAFAFWGWVALAVLQFAFCLLSICFDPPPPSGPILFAISFVASLTIVCMLHQIRVTRALLVEIDALRSRLPHPEEGAGERPSAPAGPAA